MRKHKFASFSSRWSASFPELRLWRFEMKAHIGIDARPNVCRNIAIHPGKLPCCLIDVLIENVKKLKTSMRAKVEHPFRLVKRRFSYVRVRYWTLKKNTLRIQNAVCAVQLMDSQAQECWQLKHECAKALRIVPNRTKKLKHRPAHGSKRHKSKASDLL